MNLSVLGILVLLLVGVMILCPRVVRGTSVRQNIDERASIIYEFLTPKGERPSQIHSITFSDVVGGTFEVRVHGLGEGGTEMDVLLTAEGEDEIPDNVPARIKYALGCFAPSIELRTAGLRELARRVADICNNHGLLTVNRTAKPLFVEVVYPQLSSDDGTYTRREAMGKAT